MTLQIIPVTFSEGLVDAEGEKLGDLPFIAPRNETLKPEIRFRPSLDGAGFQVAMVWQQLSQMWIARELLTRSGETVVMGVCLTSSGVDLLAPVVSTLRPAGQLWYGFEGGAQGRPGRFSWRETATLYYRPASLVSLLDGSARALL